MRARKTEAARRAPGLARRLALRLVLGLGLGACMAAGAAEPVRIKLIALNDYHGNLQSPGRFGVNALAPRVPVGGADALAAEVARLKAINPLNVVVGAGDLVGASPMISALFFDEPAVETLNAIGLEISSVGNHEFDKGAAELERLQHGGCRITDGRRDPHSCLGLGSAAPGRFDGAHFQWLAANVVERASGQPLLPAIAVRRLHGVKLGFIGVTLRGTATMVPPAGVAGLDFRDEAATVNQWVRRLHAQGVHAIVVLVHQGGYPTPPNLAGINGCDGNLHRPDGGDSEIGKIVAGFEPGVDLVLSGHTHAAYNCSADTVDLRDVGGSAMPTPRPTGLPDRSGRLLPVLSASAFGRVLSDVDLDVDPHSGRVVALHAGNRLVDASDPMIEGAILANPGVRRIVDGYAAQVAPVADQVIGAIAVPLSNAVASTGEMQTGDLVADAQLRAAQRAAPGGASIALVNAGGVRDAGLGTGAAYPLDVRYGQAFMAQPYGNNMVTLTLNSRQLKDLLEQQFPGCMGQTAPRMLQVSNGLRYAWSASAPPCSRIEELVLTPTDLRVTPPVATGAAETLVAHGVVQEPDKRWRVTVNDFIAAGGDGFSVLREGSDPVGGALGVDALADYFKAGYRAPEPPYDPALPALGIPRITRLP